MIIDRLNKRHFNVVTHILSDIGMDPITALITLTDNEANAILFIVPFDRLKAWIEL